MLRTGVDLIEIDRVAFAVTRYGARFLRRIFTPGELSSCNDRMESLAVRFAAKEAVGKALGTGIWRHGVAWSDIEVVRDSEGAPHIALHGAAAQRADLIGIMSWSVSLTHDRTHAIALVVAEIAR